MSLIKERKVENIELFYDLIFVYAISKISGIIHHPHHGVIEPWTFFNFVLASLVVLQEWLYMTNYLNRFGTFNFREIITMCVNMTAAIYLSNSFLADWSQAYYPFTISMLIMALSVAFLYHCQATKKGFGEKEAVNARNILLIVSSLLIVSLFINFYIGTILLIITNFSGVFLPLIYKIEFDNNVAKFGHLKERFELLTILFFGEMIVGIAKYFDIKHFTIYPFIALIAIFSLFGTYTILINKMINHHLVTRGLVLMYSHFFLLISLGIIISAWNLVGQELNKTFLALFYIFGYTGFYLMLFANSIYLDKEKRLNEKDFSKILGILTISFIAIFIFRQNFMIMEFSILFLTCSILLIIARKYRKIQS